MIQAGAGERGGGVSYVKLQGLDAGRLGKGATAELIGLDAAELLDGQVDGAGCGCLLEIEGKVDGSDRGGLTGTGCGKVGFYRLDGRRHRGGGFLRV